MGTCAQCITYATRESAANNVRLSNDAELFDTSVYCVVCPESILESELGYCYCLEVGSLSAHTLTPKHPRICMNRRLGPNPAPEL